MRLLLVIMLLLGLLVACEPVSAQDEFEMLYIPRLNLVARVGECPIVDGWHDTTALGNGVCHLEGTATIDHDWARIVLAGHTPGAFEGLADLREGDQVLVWNARAVEVYRVVLITMARVEDVQWLMPTDGETLTLITCRGVDRLIVHAERD